VASLSTLLRPEAVLALETDDPNSALEQLCAAAAKLVDGPDAAALLEAVHAREELSSTGFGGGLAMPHVRLESVRRLSVVVGRTPSGVPFNAIDDAPVRLFCLVVGAEREVASYQKVMGRAARFLKEEGAKLIESSDLVADVLSASERY